MSKTKIKQRNRLNLNPKDKLLKMMFAYQTTLFSWSQKINLDKSLSEIEKSEKLTLIFNFMLLIQQRLIKRGVTTNPNPNL